MSATMTATQRSPQRESEANTNESTVTGGVSQPSGSSMQEDIARLAYALWQERGCPIGSPESDWFEAEQKLVRSAERRESGLTRR
jgi:Protein of unknown function (DUF2934)